MGNFEVKNTAGKAVGSVELNDSVFGADVHEHLLWEVVKWQRANKRQGTHSVKRRGEVRGTNKKPWKQKGTGRARAGSYQSPVWVGGGSSFGPKPRDYSYTMPTKAKKKALRSALSLRAKESKLVIIDNFDVDGKTKSVTAALAALGAEQPANKVLIVDAKTNDKLVRGTKNLARSKWLAPEGLNVYDILNHGTLVITQEVAKQLEERLLP